MTLGKYFFPIQSNQGVVFARDDMTITHEEAGTMIIQQMAYVGATNILIVADDTYYMYLGSYATLSNCHSAQHPGRVPSRSLVTKLILVVMRVCQLTLDTYHSNHTGIRNQGNFIGPNDQQH